MLSQTEARCAASRRNAGENKTFYLLHFQGSIVKTNYYIFGLLCMIKCSVCVPAFPGACERTCVCMCILYMCVCLSWCECECVCVCMCACACLNFVLNILLNGSDVSITGEKREKPFSYQVKSHGRLTEHSLYHPAAAHAWLESKHS